MPQSFSGEDLYETAGGAVFDRGCLYLEEDRVGRPRRQGRRVEAVVQGSQPYRVYLDLERLDRSTCTCMYDGFCKHMVAVGLAWLEGVSEAQDAPDAVMPDMSPGKRLEHLSADDLRALVLQLVDEVDGAYAVVDRWLFGRMLQETPAEAVEGGLDALEAYLDQILDADRLGTLSEDAVEEWSPSGQRAIEELNSLDDALASVVSELVRLPEDAPLTVPGLERICRRLAEAEQEFEEISGTWHGTASMAAQEVAGRLRRLTSAERMKVVFALLPLFAEGATFLEPIARAGQSNELPHIARQLIGLGGRHSVHVAVELLLESGMEAEASELVGLLPEPDTEICLLLARHLRNRALGRTGREARKDVPTDELAASLAFFQMAVNRAHRWQKADLLAETALVYRALGRLEEEVAARTEAFRCDPTPARWKLAMAAAEEAERRDSVKAELLGWLRETEPGTRLLCSVLAAEGCEDALCLSEAVALARRLNSPDLRMEVAEVCAAETSGQTREIARALLAEAADQLALQGGDPAYGQAASAVRRLRDLAPQPFAHWYPAYRERHRRRRNLLRALGQVGL